MPKLNAPTQVMFLVSLVIVLLAIIGLFVNIWFISTYAFWVAVLGYAVLRAEGGVEPLSVPERTAPGY